MANPCTTMSDAQEPRAVHVEVGSIQLDGKEGASLRYSFVPASAHPELSKTLLVFLNGLVVPRSGWDPVITKLTQDRVDNGQPSPAVLSYDRFGQGESSLDPSDEGKEPGHGHDAMSAVRDLFQLILKISKEKSLLPVPASSQFPRLIFVCNSIGCAIARLFAQSYPATVSGLILLDSIMANSDFVSIWPDPDAPDFDPSALPEGVSPEELRDTRAKYGKVFHPNVPNKEGLSRRNLAHLLPYSDQPKLIGPTDVGPFLTVVGHDWETFAEQSFTGSMHTPKNLSMMYTNPYWQKYNEGLTFIVEKELCKGPIIAKDCGHFIQNDNPDFVAEEIWQMLERVIKQQ
ncbi:alpha/beta-hydrolase [Lepidopterella palustris CBS 459.81]|uniref:Alpha/beta-hydrolase n=1 Tax=Lepidopterella palustris CBS 459.81 TaxID=1314670 RepID=A0A8E2E8P7_9PEZI|nr:alpha/beta-hydrolase [Lepidopterella palustris CBS 459.81]